MNIILETRCSVKHHNNKGLTKRVVVDTCVLIIFVHTVSRTIRQQQLYGVLISFQTNLK